MGDGCALLRIRSNGIHIRIQGFLSWGSRSRFKEHNMKNLLFFYGRGFFLRWHPWRTPGSLKQQISKFFTFRGPCWPSSTVYGSATLVVVCLSLSTNNGDTTPERVGWLTDYVTSYFPEGENNHECHSCWMNANWKGSQNSSERGLI